MRAMASYTITKIKDGNDVDVIVTEYIKTNSGTAAPSQDDVGWSEDMPEFEAGMFLWTRNKIYINDPTEEFPIVIYTDPVLDTTWAAVNEVDRKYTEIKQDVDEVKIIAEGLEDDYAELKITSEGISTRVEGLEEVVVGNENLITNTNPAVGWEKGWSNPNANWAEYAYGRFNEDITDPFPQMVMMNPGTYYTGTLGGKEYQYKDSIWMTSPWIPEKEGVYMKPDTQYTLSFDIWRNADSVLSPISFEFDLAENPYTPAWFLSASNYDSLVPADESWHRAYATIIIPSNYVGKSTLRGVRLRFTNNGVSEVGKTSIIKIANFQLSETGLSFQDNFVNFATAINQTNKEIKLQASAIDDSKSRISLLEVNQDGILAKVEDNADNLSLVEQKVNSIKLSVTTEGDTVSLEINGSKQTIDLTGRVTFNDLKNNSNTEINGDYITTGTISATRLDLSNYSTASEVSAAISGSANGILSTVSQTYETISDANGIKDNLATNYYNKSTIDQKIDAISLAVTANGKTVYLILNGKTQSIDLSGYASFTDLEGNGTTTINGANIKTGSISADRVTGGTLQGTTIKGNTIIGGSFTTETALDDGNKFEVEIKNGRIVGLSYNPSTLLRGAKGFMLDSSGIGVLNYTGGLHSTVLSIDDSGDTHFDVSGDLLLNAKIVGRDADLDDVVANSVATNQINGKAFPGGYSLSEFANNAISMATAYTNSAGTSGGADISMGNITEIDSAGVFSRARYSSSYGYGIRCSKAGYYLVSAHGVLSNKVATAQNNTFAVRKVVGGTSTYIARHSIATPAETAEGIVYTHDISPMLVYLDADTYLSLYASNSNFATTNQGCYISAVYLGI